MSRKKHESYGDLSRAIATLHERMEAEKKRITETMASYLVISAKDISALADFNRTELRRTMTLLSGYLGICIQQVVEENTMKQVVPAVVTTPDFSLAEPFDEEQEGISCEEAIDGGRTQADYQDGGYPASGHGKN